MYLSIFEWLGTILALSGAALMAANRSPIVCFLMWLGSNFSFIYVFSNTGNNGLLFMNLMSIIINLFGIYQWKEKEHLVNDKVTKFLFYVFLIILGFSIWNLINFAITPKLSLLEWFASSLGVASAFLLSSRHKLTFLCWFFWSFSNIILMYIGFNGAQYGFMTLQFGFMLTNIYGSYNWYLAYREKHILIPIDKPSQG